MADTLRDLVVNLSLESDNFSKNIKSINSQIREAESEFKAAGAGVNGFEGSLDGVQAKAQMLQKKMELQAKAVQQYEKALSAASSKLQASYARHEQIGKALDEAKAKYAELAAAYGENSDEAKAQAAEVKKLEGQLTSANRTMQSAADGVTKATANLNNAKAALADTEKELARANEEAEKQASAWTKAGKALDDFSKKAGEIGKNVTSAGKSLTVGLTAPIAALGTASVAAFNEVDGGLDTIVTKTGATGRQLESLTASFENVFGSLPVTAEEAGVAIGEVNTRFGLTEKALENVSAQFLRFSKINSVDLNSSIDGVDKLMTKFGVDASRVNEVLGYMTKVGQDTGLSMSTIISSLQSNGEALKDIGLDLGSSIALLAQFEASGVDAGTALTAMKKAVQSAAAGGRDASQAFSETVAAIKAAKTETEALTIATALFGSRGAAEMVAAIREGRMDVDKLGETMDKYADVVRKTFDATQDLPDETTKAMNRLKLAGAELGKSLMAQVVPAVTTLVESAGSLVDKLKSMDDGTKQTLIRTAAIAAAVGPIVSVAGKMISSIGTITGLLGKFSTAVGAAGGGMKGLGAVLASSPAMWLALGAAVAYGTYKLIDYATGAKAVREAMEGMNKAAENWRNNDANTMYGYAKGLTAFGMSASDFTTRAGDGFKWLKNLTTEWADELSESDETIEQYIGSFKDMTNSTREGLKKIAQQAADAGYDEMSAQLQSGLKELDAMDARVSELLKKRKESFLTAEDVQELNDLIYRRQQIEVRYKLVDESNGFDQIETKVNAALEKAKATGADTGEVYKDALVASAQGMAAVNKELSEEYDTRYQLIQMMDEQTQAAEKQQRLEELNAWYANERAEAGRKYGKLMGEYMNNVLSPDKIKATNQQMADLYTLITKYSKGEANIQALSDATMGLDESTIAEYYAQLTQLQSLLDQGLDASEFKKLTGLDTKSLEDAFNRLEKINGALASLNTDEQLDSLRSMFGKSLGEEVLKIATDLDMTGAQARWKEFANNPGSKVFTDAIVNSYAEKEGGADKRGLSPEIQAYVAKYLESSTVDKTALSPSGIVALVAGYAESRGIDKSKLTPGDIVALVTAYNEAAGVSTSALTPSGLIAYVSAYNEVNGGASKDALKPEVAEAFVKAYQEITNGADTAALTPGGLTALVAAYAEISTGASTASLSPKDLTALVSAYAEATGVDVAKLTPSGIVAIVSAYQEIASGASTAGLAPSDIVAFVSAYQEAKTGASKNGLTPEGILALVSTYNEIKNGASTKALTPSQITAFVSAYAEAKGGAVKTSLTPSDITALVSAYKADPDGVDQLVANPSGFSALVNAYAADPDGVTNAIGDPTGFSALVAGYKADPQHFVDNFPDAAGKVAIVEAYAKATEGFKEMPDPTGLIAYVSKYAKVAKDFGEFPDPDALIAYVAAYAKASNFTEFTGPEDLIATITAYKLAKGVKEPELTSNVTLNDLSAEAVKKWQAANGPKVNLVADTSVSLGLKFGPGWEKDAKDLIDANMLKLYTADGIQIPVTPEAVGQLTASSLVVGVDEDGTYHVIVTPKWQEMSTEETEQGVEDLTGAIDKARENIKALNKEADKGIFSFGTSGPGGGGYDVGWQVIDQHAQSLADTVTAVAMAAKNGQSIEGAADLLTDISAAVAAFPKGRSSEFINTLVSTLNTAGVEVKASDLPEYLRNLSGAMHDLDVPDDSELGEYFQQLNWIVDKEGMLEKLPAMSDVVKRLLTYQAGGGELSDFQKAFLADFATAVDAFDLESEAAKLGLQVDSGMAAGVASGASQVTNAIVKLAQDAIAAAKETLDIHSPSRVFRNEVGAMVMKGFGQGIVDQTEAQARIIRNAARYLTGEAQTAIAGVGASGTMNTYNSSASINFAGATFQVRDQQDINTLAREIASLTKRQQRGGGLRR